MEIVEKVLQEVGSFIGGLVVCPTTYFLVCLFGGSRWVSMSMCIGDQFKC
jgi:hypothetical protein